MRAAPAAPAALLARTTYDAAHEHFDAAPLRFWSRYGRASVERLGLARGARVLDLCAGTGGSALPAARAVGPEGRVVAVDVSPSLLARARQKAERVGIRNVDFQVADMTRLDFVAEFDAVLLGFGIFFADDMPAQIRAIHRMLRPGGRLALTTWAARLFAPLYEPFLASVRAERPDIEDYRPWDRLTRVGDVEALLGAAPFAEVAVVEESGLEPLDHPDDWWTIVLGTGLRRFVDQLRSPASVEAVRRESLRRAAWVGAVETNVIHAIARKAHTHEERKEADKS